MEKFICCILYFFTSPRICWNFFFCAQLLTGITFHLSYFRSFASKLQPPARKHAHSLSLSHTQTHTHKHRHTHTGECQNYLDMSQGFSHFSTLGKFIQFVVLFFVLSFQEKFLLIFKLRFFRVVIIIEGVFEKLFQSWHKNLLWCHFFWGWISLKEFSSN